MIKRLGGLNVGNPFPLYVVAKNKIDNARGLEKAFHKKLKHKKVNGEWFELSPPEVLELCTIIHSKKKRKKFLYKSTPLLTTETMRIYEKRRREWEDRRENLFRKEKKKSLPKAVPDLKPPLKVQPGSADDAPTVAEAASLIKLHNRASASFLQSKLSIGYAKAARIMEALEEKGVVGPHNGSKPRAVLI